MFRYAIYQLPSLVESCFIFIITSRCHWILAISVCRIAQPEGYFPMPAQVIGNRLSFASVTAGRNNRDSLRSAG